MKAVSRRFHAFVLIAVLIGYARATILAQEQIRHTTAVISVPGAEKFVSVDFLVMPWRSTTDTCSRPPNPKVDCRIVTEKEFLKSHFLSIYGPDGGIWYQFSVDPTDPSYYAASPKQIINPLGPSLTDTITHPWVILRLVRESSNWYEVEVNKDTRETKFIPKSDPLWSKVSWSDVFNMSANVVVDQTKVKLRDKPEGAVISECAGVTYDRMNFGRLEGEWMFVRAGNSISRQLCDGWIRWRNGDDILVGSVLNGMKVPASNKSLDSPKQN